MTGKFKSRQILLPLLCALASGAWATEYGSVVSSTPVLASVPVPQRQCSDEPVSYRQSNSGAGALIGAVVGAAVGNSFGAGAGRAAATGLGMVAGAAIGDRAEVDSQPPASRTVQRCRTVERYENRTVGYDVVYDYQGVRRSVRMARDPGDRVALNISVAPSDTLPPVQGPAQRNAPVYGSRSTPSEYDDAPQPRSNYVQPGYYEQPAYYAPPAYYAAPAYYAPPGYYAQPFYANPWPYFAIGLGVGSAVGWHGHHRR
jgi:uncharacterized protein YcfJ